jgi:hypothetical protein
MKKNYILLGDPEIKLYNNYRHVGRDQHTTILDKTCFYFYPNAF